MVFLDAKRPVISGIDSMIFLDAKRPVISGIDCAGILKDLSREVKNAERISLKVKKKDRKIHRS